MAAPAKRAPGRPRTVNVTIAEAWRLAIVAQLEAANGIAWPSTKYRDDPVGFARDILGVELWSRQEEILQAVRDHKRVAVSSGNKLGKTAVAAVAAIWWFCSFENARVRMTAAKADQIRDGIYREIRTMLAGAGTCLDCKRTEAETGIPAARPCEHSALIDDVRIGKLPATGVVAADLREMIGRTASSPEAARGLSSPNTLVIYDEATGVPDDIYEGMATSIAGGGHILAISNPTKCEGWFFGCFHGSAAAKEQWHTLTVSTEENPNVIEDREVIPGLATREWIEGEIAKHGEDSPEVLKTIKGRFPIREEGRIFPLHKIEEAVTRWYDCAPCGGTGYVADDVTCDRCAGTGSAGQTGQPGPLFLGIDPAGETGTGDDSCFAVRRGRKVVELIERKGMSEDEHLVEILSIVSRYCAPKEIPIIIADTAGSIGARLHGRILAHLSEARRDRKLRAFDYCPFRSGDKATRDVNGYETQRDELAASLALMMRDGLALPPETRLHDELLVLQWTQRSDGKLKLTPKREIKRVIGRSPDRYDAVSLACWTPSNLIDAATAKPPPPPARDEIPQIGSRDPYAYRDSRGGFR